MSVSASGYLRIGATDVDAWMDFGTGVLGLMDAGREDSAGARFLRLDDHPFRFMVEPADADGLIATGLEFPTEDAWQRACDAVAESGQIVTPGSAEEAKRRCVTAFASTSDPSGNRDCSVITSPLTRSRSRRLLDTSSRYSSAPNIHEPLSLAFAPLSVTPNRSLRFSSRR